MQRHTANMKAYRHRKRQAEKEVKSRGIIKDYPYHEKSGRPRIEEYERGKDLAATMQRVADTNSSTDARRRTENVQVNFSARSFAKKVNEDIDKKGEGYILVQKRINEKWITVMMTIKRMEAVTMMFL
eukprot:630329_1